MKKKFYSLKEVQKKILESVGVTSPETGLARIEEIWKKKYGNMDIGDSLTFDLNKVSLYDIEKLIRAVEICTLRWTLGKGGGLNVTENINSMLKGINQKEG